VILGVKIGGTGELKFPKYMWRSLFKERNFINIKTGQKITKEIQAITSVFHHKIKRTLKCQGLLGK